MTILTSVIRFLVVILIGIPHVIIRDAEHLILCPSGDYFLCFSLKCEKKMYLLQLAS